MEKILLKMVQSGVASMEDLIQRVGPKVLAYWGPKLGKVTNEIIRQHIPGWPF